MEDKLLRKRERGKCEGKRKKRSKRGKKSTPGKEEKEVRVMREKEKEKGRKGGIPDALLLVSSGLNLLFLSHRALNLLLLPSLISPVCRSISLCVGLGGEGGEEDLDTLCL